MPVISLANVWKVYSCAGGGSVTALRDLTFDVESGEFIAVRGASGSGKSTLLNIVGCLDRPTRGTYRFEGEDASGWSDQRLSQLRSRRIGFVFQAFHLLPRTTAVENVELPMVYAGGAVDRLTALTALRRVGLDARAHHYGNELSGGEQQRVAIARALINDPALILADEPTGNLDSMSGREVMQLLQSLSRDGCTVVLVTHDDDIAAYAHRELVLEDGAIVVDRSTASTPA